MYSVCSSFFNPPPLHKSLYEVQLMLYEKCFWYFAGMRERERERERESAKICISFFLNNKCYSVFRFCILLVVVIHLFKIQLTNVRYKRMLIKLNDVWLFQYAYKVWLIDWFVFASYRLYFSHLTSGILDINNVYIRFWINTLMIILFKKRLQI